MVLVAKGAVPALRQEGHVNPRRCGRGVFKNCLLTRGQSASQRSKQGPPDGGREHLAAGSLGLLKPRGISRHQSTL
jgi:hypothetical protein